MTHFTQIILLTLVLLLSGCASRLRMDANALSATESVIRSHRSDPPSAKVLFVAINHDDPPEGFVSRFSDFKKPVKVASAANYGERLVGGRYSGIRDIATGQRGWLYSARVIRRLGPNSFEIELSGSGGALSGGRCRVKVTRQEDGRWHQESIGPYTRY